MARIAWTLAATVALGAVAAPATRAGESVAYQVDPAHDGELNGDSLNPPLNRLWSRDLGGTTSYALIADGKVFALAATNGGSTLYALDERTGATIWSRVLGSYATRGPAYDSGSIFTVTQSGLLQAFSDGNGATQWSTQLPGQYSFSAAPTAADGVVYTGGAGSGGTLYATRETDGALLWSQPVENGDDSSPAFDGTRVYVSYVGPQVYGFNVGSGTQAWHYSGSSEGGGGTTAVVYRGRLYVRDPVSSDYVFDAANGQIVDSFNSSVAPAFYQGTGLYLTGGNLRAEDTASGQTLWSFTGDGTLDTAAIAVNGVAYVGSAQGNMYAIDITSGRLVWSAPVGAAVNGVDEHNGPPLGGLSAGDDLVTVPAGTTLVVYAGAGGPPPGPTTSTTNPQSSPSASAPPQQFTSLRAVLRHFRRIVQIDARRATRAARALRKGGGAAPLTAALATLRHDLASFVAAVKAQHPRSPRLRRGKRRLLHALSLYQRGAAGLSRSITLAAAHHSAAARRTAGRSTRSLSRGGRSMNAASPLILHGR